jgi:uncharacterized tellurite resistance protein B-like protein
MSVNAGSPGEPFAIPSHDPFATQEREVGSFWSVMLRTLVLMMMADNVVDPRELEALTEIYQRSGLHLDERRLRLELKAIEENRQEPVAYLLEQVEFLSEDDKMMLLDAACKVAYADGNFQQEERELIEAMAKSLDVSQEKLKDLLDAEPEKS